MKTGDLIEVLAKDTAANRSLGFALAAGGLTGLAGALALYLGVVGPRPDFVSALENWRFVVKLALVAAALVLMAIGFRRAMGPMQRSPQRLLAVIFAALAVAVIAELLIVPPEYWAKFAIGHNALVCLITIPALSVVPLVAALWAMRSGAPASPVQAGAIAGGLSAALGALLYATHCPDDSPLFVAIWYPLAAAAMVAVGALAGRYVLRW
jgi:hypothetical protein